ncbi:MAG TPA: right-handed parallel beta-helix repeat-containing protein [Thermoanaerobaculia bacterium]|nr:right-handed parallel beta-helix repeat-containing protein [Thermoanaerobaculia bacterium]
MNPTLRLRLLPLLLLVPVLAGAQPAARRVFYVDNSRQTGDGTAAAPFATLRQAESASAANDVIVVRGGASPYRESIALKDGQLLAGATAKASEELISRGIAITKEASPATPPVIAPESQDAISFASNNSVIDIVVRVSSGAAIAARANAGETTLDHVRIELAGNARGLAMTATNGSIFVRDGAFAGGGAAAISIDGGGSTVQLERTPIHATGGSALSIRDRTGGTVSLDSGSAIELVSSGSEGISIVDSAGIYTFAGALKIETKGAPALRVRSCGSVAISDASSTFATEDAAAVDIRRAAIDIVLRGVDVRRVRGSIDDGIVLERTTGRFSVAGGTISDVRAHAIAATHAETLTFANMRFLNAPLANGIDPLTCFRSVIDGENIACHAAVMLDDVKNAVFDHVVFDGGVQNAINGRNVDGLTLNACEIRRAGDEAGETAMQFSNLTGDVRIAGSHIHDNAARHLYIHNRRGVLRLAIEDSTFAGVAKSPVGEQGALVTAADDARIDLTVSGSKFERHVTNAIQAVAQDRASMHAAISGSTFSGHGGSALTLNALGAARLTFDVEKNNLTDNGGAAIVVYQGVPSSGSVAGTIAGNTIGRAGAPASGASCGSCSGIMLTASGNGRFSARVSGNTIQQFDGSGIRVTAGTGAASANVIISGNTIRQPVGASATAIRVQSGTSGSDKAAVCADVRSNSIAAGGWDPNGAIQLVNRFPTTTLRLPGFTGDGKSIAAVAAFVARNNGASGVRAALTSKPEGNTFSGGPPCAVQEGSR